MKKRAYVPEIHSPLIRFRYYMIHHMVSKKIKRINYSTNFGARRSETLVYVPDAFQLGTKPKKASEQGLWK